MLAWPHGAWQHGRRETGRRERASRSRPTLPTSGACGGVLLPSSAPWIVHSAVAVWHSCPSNAVPVTRSTRQTTGQSAELRAHLSDIRPLGHVSPHAHSHNLATQYEYRGPHLCGHSTVSSPPLHSWASTHHREQYAAPWKRPCVRPRARRARCTQETGHVPSPHTALRASRTRCAHASARDGLYVLSCRSTM